MKRSYSFSVRLMIAFLISDLVVVFCHMRNPFMGFLSTRSSYVLFIFTICSMLAVPILRFVPDLTARRSEKHPDEEK